MSAACRVAIVAYILKHVVALIRQAIRAAVSINVAAVMPANEDARRLHHDMIITMPRAYRMMALPRMMRRALCRGGMRMEHCAAGWALH